MRVRLLIMFMMLTGMLAYADDYQLHKPSPQGYVDHVAQILELADTSYVYREYYNIDLLAEASAIEDEFNWRYINEDRLTYDQIATLYSAYEVSDYASAGKTPPNKDWLRQVTSLWLEENPIKLVEVDEFMMGDFRVEIKPLTDFQYGYVRLEGGYLLRVHESEFKSSQYIAIETESGKYSLPMLPESIDGAFLASGDLDNDGLPEIAYLHTEVWAMNSYFIGSMVIAEFKNNKFEMQTAVGYKQGPQEESHNWWFINLNNRSDFELVLNQRLYTIDWACDFIQTRIYGWTDEGQLNEESRKDVYPATFNCLLLQAEQAMWSNNFSNAVNLYERAFEAGNPSEDFIPHTQIRLGLAYLLTDHAEKAQKVFADLARIDSDYAHKTLASYQKDPRALPLCQTMYNYAFEGEERLQSNGHLQTYDGAFNRFDVGISYFNLENATCNLAYLMDKQLQTMTFLSTESPLMQIQDLGLEIANTLEIDFDMDGQKEWLIWLDAPGVPPLLFTLDGDSYQVSQLRELSPFIRQATEYNHYGVMTLPNRIEQVIVNVDYDLNKWSEINCASSCGGYGAYTYCSYGNLKDTPQSIGHLTIWQMQAGSIVNSLRVPLCDLIQVDDIISNGDAPLEIDAGQYVFSPDNEFDASIVPAVYLWDDELKSYVLPPQAPSNPIPTLTPFPEIESSTQERVYALSNYDFIQLRPLFAQEDYQSIIHIVDVALSNPENTEYDVTMYENAFRYYRALALEAFNRPDEALTEYINIYESEPDSAWGILAHLHFEIIE